MTEEKTATNESENQGSEAGPESDQTSRLEFEPVAGLDYVDVEMELARYLCRACKFAGQCTDMDCGLQEELLQMLYDHVEIEEEEIMLGGDDLPQTPADSGPQVTMNFDGQESGRDSINDGRPNAEPQSSPDPGGAE